ncbi:MULTISPECIES: Pycsar system effector family protein [Lactiplantibacillus]|uniref:Pycsar system effector family protein n=1 Tax=Lactiplantibacillus TaxID=2767842 RepID=UPI00080F7251|nr:MULTISPECIES: Pycsar system effector family protein [Lactiplantibacillus]
MENSNYEKTKYLQYLLDKQLDWIQKSDTKASVLLSAIGILFTLLINSRFYSVLVNCIHYLFIKDKIVLMVLIFLLVFGLVLVFIGGFYLFFTLIPRLKNISQKQSYIFFGDISQNGLTELRNHFSKDLDPNDDLINQIFVNANIANVKMKNCNIGIKFICLGFGIVFIVTLISSIGISIK